MKPISIFGAPSTTFIPHLTSVLFQQLASQALTDMLVRLSPKHDE